MILNHGMIYGITALTGYTTRARAMAEAKRLSRALVEHPRRTTTKAGVGPKGAVGAPPLRNLEISDDKPRPRLG